MTALPSLIPTLQVVKDCEHVFNLAADMGGMGFIQSNHSVIMYNNTMISFHMLEVSRILGIKRSDSWRVLSGQEGSANQSLRVALLGWLFWMHSNAPGSLPGCTMS